MEPRHGTIEVPADSSAAGGLEMQRAEGLAGVAGVLVLSSGPTPRDQADHQTARDQHDRAPDSRWWFSHWVITSRRSGAGRWSIVPDYFSGEKSVGDMKSDSTFAVSRPFTSDAVLAFVHSGSAAN